MSVPKFTREVCATKCACGHPSCDQYVLNTQRSSGFGKADADLYVAAPDLYAALEELLAAQTKDAGETDRRLARIDAENALAKARGEA